MSGRWIVVVGAVACTLALAFLQLGRSSEPEAGASSEAGATEVAKLRAEVARLEVELAQAAEQEQRLQEEGDWLREELHDLQAEFLVEEGAARDEEVVALELDKALLLDAGLDPGDLEALRERLDAIALERLYLRDEAEREGSRGSKRWHRERRALELSRSELRDEFGDELFDWGLYASEQVNRVKVKSVLRGSPAEEAGLRAGDAILEYDGNRIFRAKDLREGARGGSPGRPTEVLVWRDGGTHRLFLPRGPLGIMIEPSTMRPQPY